MIRSILDEDDQEQEATPLVVSAPEIADKRVGDVLNDAPMIGLLQVRRSNALCTICILVSFSQHCGLSPGSFCTIWRLLCGLDKSGLHVYRRRRKVTIFVQID